MKLKTLKEYSKTIKESYYDDEYRDDDYDDYDEYEDDFADGMGYYPDSDEDMETINGLLDDDEFPYEGEYDEDGGYYDFEGDDDEIDEYFESKGIKGKFKPLNESKGNTHKKRVVEKLSTNEKIKHRDLYFKPYKNQFIDVLRNMHDVAYENGIDENDAIEFLQGRIRYEYLYLTDEK